MTNPQKKKKQEVMAVWQELKQKLLTTITELQANHKDNWAVVSSKSQPQSVFYARDKTGVELCQELNQRLALIRQLISNQDYAKLQRLYEQGGI